MKYVVYSEKLAVDYGEPVFYKAVAEDHWVDLSMATVYSDTTSKLPEDGTWMTLPEATKVVNTYEKYQGNDDEEDDYGTNLKTHW